MVTPSLNVPRVQGGTLYTFNSASRDLTRTFSNTDYTFKFSHFACIDLPDMVLGDLKAYREAHPTDDPKKGLALFNTFTGYTISTFNKHGNVLNSDGINLAFAEHLQDYALNFENVIINGEYDEAFTDYDDYDSDYPAGYDNYALRTPAERVFWNWLEKIGGINFGENILVDGSSSATGANLYGELEDATADRTVKYIGDIDIINSVEIEGDTYNELYIHVPSSVGATPRVLFANISDTTYITDFDYSVEGEYIQGRDEDYGENHKTQYGLQTEAIYDEGEGESSDSDAKNYYTAKDGHCISFNFNDYKNIAPADINSIMEYNGTSMDNFEFNAVLVYYDTINKTTNEKATNLYGIIILEEFTDMSADVTSGDNDDEVNSIAYIQSYPKFRQNESLGFNGNSYALKVDIKTDTNPTSTGSQSYYVDPNSAASLEVFAQAMDRMQECCDMFYTQQLEFSKLRLQINDLYSILGNSDTIAILSSKLESLQNEFENSSVGVDTQTIYNLLIQNSQQINEILNGKTPLELQYDTSAIEAGYGISTVKDSSVSQLVISTKNNSYNIRPLWNASGDDITSTNPLKVNYTSSSTAIDVHMQLGEMTNLAVLHIDDSNYTCSNAVTFYIDDTVVNWKVGQSVKLIIEDYIDFDAHDLIIYTGVSDDEYKQFITISGDSIPTKANIEIICTDADMTSSGDKFIYEINNQVVVENMNYNPTQIVYGEGGGSDSDSDSEYDPTVISEIKASISELYEDVSTLDGKISLTNASVKSLEETVESVSTRVTTLRSSVTSLTNTVTSVCTSVSNLSSELSGLSSTVDVTTLSLSQLMSYNNVAVSENEIDLGDLSSVDYTTLTTLADATNKIETSDIDFTDKVYNLIPVVFSINGTETKGYALIYGNTEKIKSKWLAERGTAIYTLILQHPDEFGFKIVTEDGGTVYDIPVENSNNVVRIYSCNSINLDSFRYNVSTQNASKYFGIDWAYGFNRKCETIMQFYCDGGIYSLRIHDYAKNQIINDFMNEMVTNPSDYISDTSAFEQKLDVSTNSYTLFGPDGKVIANE